MGVPGEVECLEEQPRCGGQKPYSRRLDGAVVEVPLGDLIVQEGVVHLGAGPDLGTVFLAAVAAPTLLIMLDSVQFSGKVVVLVEDEAEWFTSALQLSFVWTKAASWVDFWDAVRDCPGRKTILGQSRSSPRSDFDARFMKAFGSISMADADVLLLISACRFLWELYPSTPGRPVTIRKIKHSNVGGITTNMYFALSSSKSDKAGASIKESAIKRSLASVTKVDVSGIPVNEPPSKDTSVGVPFLEAESQLPSRLLSSWFCLTFSVHPFWVGREKVRASRDCSSLRCTSVSSQGFSKRLFV